MKTFSLAACIQRYLQPQLLLIACAIVLAGPVRGADEPAALSVGGTGSGTALLKRLNALPHPSRLPPLQALAPSLGSSGGIRALLAGQIELAVLGREPTAQEMTLRLQTRPWVDTPLVLASSARQGDGLSASRLLEILLENTPRDPRGEPFNLVLRYPQEADMQALRQLSPEMDRALQQAIRRPQVAMADNDLDALALLSRTPNSLGPTTLGLLRTENAQLHLLRWHDTTPSLEALRNGAYPLRKRLYLVWQTPASAALRSWLEWLQQAAVQRQLQELGYQLVPVYGGNAPARP